MKTNWIVLGASFAMAFLVSCMEKGYEARVTLDGFDGKYKAVYLLDSQKNAIDSASAVEGIYVFKGTTDSLMSCYLALRNKSGHLFPYTRVFLQNGTLVNVTIGRNTALDDNGGANSAYGQFMNRRTEINDVYRDAVKGQKDFMSEVVKKASVTYQTQMEQLWKEIVEMNFDNAAGAAVLADMCRSIKENETFDAYYEKVVYAKLFPELDARKAYFKQLAKTSEGKMFIDFDGKSVEGKSVKLSDYVGKGKYVVVDFWASWCVPCKKEIPNLIAVEKKYGGKDFMVLGINVWDKEDKFKAALKTEKINYPQIFVDKREVTSTYGITGIPQIMLFGPDGKVVKRDLRGEAIEYAVKECLKK